VGQSQAKAAARLGLNDGFQKQNDSKFNIVSSA